MLTAMGWLHSLVASGDFLNNRAVPSLGWYGRPYLYELVASLPYALGWPLYALALVGVVVALWRHELADRVLLGALIPYFLVIGGSPTTFPRYLMPLFPGLVILAARAVVAF
jgi:4-amino-4-deoxy-L-arabinose transferase-like glycosyltransferase